MVLGVWEWFLGGTGMVFWGYGNGFHNIVISQVFLHQKNCQRKAVKKQDSFSYHSWYGNESTCAEKSLNPRIASSGKGIL